MGQERCCLVVGADRIGAMTRLKKRLGTDDVIHWDGRRRPPKSLPKSVNTVVIYTGLVSHNAMYAVKKLARANGVRIVFLGRGLAELDVQC